MAAKGHKVRNVINRRHRTTKEPVMSFCVDLEPQQNNKGVYNINYLNNMKIRVQAPYKMTHMIHCTRCQLYDHLKSYYTKPFKCFKWALCENNYPENYMGCTVYADLLNSRQQQIFLFILTVTAEQTLSIQWNYNSKEIINNNTLTRTNREHQHHGTTIEPTYFNVLQGTLENLNKIPCLVKWPLSSVNLEPCLHS